MSGAVRTMTPGQAKELAIILAQAGLTDLTYEQAKRLLANKGELNAGVRLLQARLAGVDQPDTESAPAPAKPAEPKPAHSAIRFERTVGSEQIYFVGFIRDDDTDGYVLDDAMFERVRGAGFEPVDDSKPLDENRKDWANDAELDSYYVVTNERHPEGSRRVRCFDRGGRGRFWYYPGRGFDRLGLVACRAA